MRRSLFAFIFVAALLSSAVVVFADSDSSDAATPTEVTGYLVTKGDNTTQPAVGVWVKLYLEGSTTYCHGDTNNDGKFTINISSLSPADNKIRISLEDEEYVIFVGQGPMAKKTAREWEITLPDMTGTFALNDGTDCGILIGSGTQNYEVTVKGTINGVEKFLNNAIITLQDEDGVEYSGETSNGKYKFEGITFGPYKIKVTCNGFQTYNGNIVIDDEHTNCTIPLEEKEIPTIYGITTYHALLFLGVMVGLVLVTISFILVRRNWKGMKD